MIEVACAIVQRQDGRILLAQRSAKMKHPLQWEFPGGKLEAGESAWQALTRELQEELELQVIEKKRLKSVTWNNGEVQILLHPIVCQLEGALPTLKEHRDCCWLHPEQMNELPLLQADREIIKQL